MDGDGVSWPEDCDDEDAAIGAASTWYTDGDGDGHGDPATQVEACAQPTDSVLAGDDCDDVDAARSPGAAELCGDAVVQDCDGTEEEAASACAFAGEGEADDADAALAGAEESGFAGYAVALGDVDGDGGLDFVVGAPGERGNRGAVYVVSGPTPTSGSLSALGLVLTGPAAETGAVEGMAGYALSAPRDLNGDGYADLVIGAPARESFLSMEGESTTSCDPGVAYLVTGPIGAMDLSDADGQARDAEDSLCFGYSVLVAGDLDGDGSEDVAIGAPTRYAPSSAPSVTVFSGEPGGGLETRRLKESPGTLAGAALASADLTGDGGPDLVIGAYGGEHPHVYVLDGADTASDVALISSEAAASVEGEQSGTNFGGALATGDMNGDGAHDLAVGADRDDEAANDAGAATVYYGPLDAERSSDEADVTLGCDEPNCRLSRSLALFDLDGDGAAELLAGAPEGDMDSETGGLVAILFGASDLTGEHEAKETAEGARAGYLRGETGDLIGFGVGAWSDGQDVWLHASAARRDVAGVESAGAVLFFSGWQTW